MAAGQVCLPIKNAVAENRKLKTENPLTPAMTQEAKFSHNATPQAVDLPHLAMAGIEAGAALLLDFPDPVIITDGQRQVAFLNHAARRLFGDVLKPGDLCPVCPALTVLPLSADGRVRHERCLMPGESLSQAPIRLNSRWQTLTPLLVSANPIRGAADGFHGCLVMLREQQDLSSHPVVQLQLATLASILENFPTPFFMVDPDLVITHINQRMERLTGYARQEVVGKKTCGEILNTVQCNTCDCVLKQVMEKHHPLSGLRRVVRDRQGHEIPVVVSASIITDPAGRVIGGFEAMRDISPVVEAEKKIDLITNLTREGILMADEAQRVIFANQRLAEILDRPREDLIGKEIGQVLLHQHQRMAVEGVQRASQGESYEVQFCSRLEYGDPRYFETCMAAAQVGQKTITCIYLRDLTERVTMEQEIQRSHAFLMNIIQNSVDGIVVVDAKGVPLIFNEGAERILGYQAEEILGTPENLYNFYPKPLAVEMMRRLRSPDYGPIDRLPTTRVTFLNKKGEEVPVNFSAAIIREGGQEVGSVGIFSDLRELVEVHRELESVQSQLVQAAKIASLGRLAAGVAHEINNPLAGILIYAELMQRDLGENVALRENMEVIIHQTMRCQQIVQRLLDFSRQSLGEKKLFDINAIIRRGVELISHQALFHNIQVNLNLDPELPHLVGDPGQLQQVFTNLLLNAADAMAGRGEITVTAEPNPDKDAVIITFADNGPGIPPEIRDKIFEPFFTTKPPGQGTGLGLSIVYGVIQRHDGVISVDCPDTGGARFIIRLPLEPSDHPPEQLFA
jgi:PAS domain S-box-containing protein